MVYAETATETPTATRRRFHRSYSLVLNENVLKAQNVSHLLFSCIKIPSRRYQIQRDATKDSTFLALQESSHIP